MRLVLALLAIAVVAHAEEPRLLVVLPIDDANTTLDDAALRRIEEQVRTDARAAWGSQYVVVTGVRTRTALVDNGVDLSLKGAQLTAAKELKARVVVTCS